MLESQIQKRVIDRLEEEFQGIIVLKNDANYLQGFPDLTAFYNGRFAVLEVKQSLTASVRPNQEHYINTLNGPLQGFARFVYPENLESVIDEMRQWFWS